MPYRERGVTYFYPHEIEERKRRAEEAKRKFADTCRQAGFQPEGARFVGYRGTVSGPGSERGLQVRNARILEETATVGANIKEVRVNRDGTVSKIGYLAGHGAYEGMTVKVEAVYRGQPRTRAERDKWYRKHGW